ncbi:MULTISPECIES: electron transport complex subunit RsxC [unclassified Blautia]|uniref:electron transport complex subunit RsxC n=1 Tax=unclassified Blautia TaxID=2648079 RepID=UPI000B3B002C|nr:MULTISPECIES: electron transport complex subunit RsxC [unclassified Blautia]OUN31271.1 electron transport complex subunit RsxC [Blautia sp. An81]OUN92276.1 electron transport complex subunit RsxC [Blautia sp. An46]
MAFLTFRGGVHPYDGKELSKEKPVRELLPGKELVYPLSQHIGAPAKPIVAKGDHVLAGQKIAEMGGFVSANIHASVSGTVKEIKKVRNNVGAMVDAIVVENDEKYETVEFQSAASLEALSKEEVLERIKEGGVVGMGGAGFPTHVKLAPKEPEKIEYVLVNGAECEPYLTSDYRRMLEQPEWIIGGLKCILKLFDNAKGYICIEDNKPDCISKLTEMVKDEPKIEVKTLKTKYPQGAERCLIYAVSGREINSSMLPADAGCVVDNIDTVCAVYRAVMAGEPVMDRIVTVTGEAVADPCNFKAKMGMSFAELLEAAGGLKQPAKKIVSGGPMMGFAMFDYHVPVVKTSSAMLCMTEDDISEKEPTACINCGRCVNACPARLVPSRLATYSEHGQAELFEKHHGMECVECGCCSFVCPAKRPLTQSMRSMRKMVMANRRKAK